MQRFRRRRCRPKTLRSLLMRLVYNNALRVFNSIFKAERLTTEGKKEDRKLKAHFKAVYVGGS